MEKQFFSLVLITALMMSCASANALGLSGDEGNEWKLIEVYIDGRGTRFSRNTLPEELSNFFTLILDDEIISGVGAPNRYSASYALSDNQINIALMRSTMMASFFNLENLNEYDFFFYMQNAYEWKLVNENLELLSKTENGSEVRLVFSL